MEAHAVDDNLKPATDELLLTLANYTATHTIQSPLAYETARYCLMDAIGCGLLALQYPACTKLLGPVVPGTTVPKGSRVPGTGYVLDPILAAFNIGTLVRWLDFNDTWLAAEWGHPSDNLGAILAVADYVSQQRTSPLTMKDVLTAMIKAHEIQGVLALENAFNRLGFDHVILVKIASTAVAAHLFGGNATDIANALSQAWLDGAALRTYRHAPNTGSRKSWAAGDATSRATRLAFMTRQGEMGYQSPLTAKKWGFYDALTHGKPLTLGRSLDAYVMENVLFKISYPAEFHAQTAVECAVQLHPHIINRLNHIQSIVLTTQEPAIRIISKSGELRNPADRDHCLQYMVAIGLLHGNLTADHYEDACASDPRIDQLREKMRVVEDKRFSTDYLDENKRSIANAVQIFFDDGTHTEQVVVEYPIGHRRRREAGLPLLFKKFESNAKTCFSAEKTAELLALFHDENTLLTLPVPAFMEKFVKN